MHNDPELDGKYLGSISQDFVRIADTLREASYQIRKRNFSQYPIFPICKVQQSIGQLLINREDYDLQWNYYTTYMDEFVQRKLITEEHSDAFKASYRDPDEYCCLFVVDEAFTKFLYIPYPVD